jgi:hypothetical protein
MCSTGLTTLTQQNAYTGQHNKLLTALAVSASQRSGTMLGGEEASKNGCQEGVLAGMHRTAAVVGS